MMCWYCLSVAFVSHCRCIHIQLVVYSCVWRFVVVLCSCCRPVDQLLGSVVFVSCIVFGVSSLYSYRTNVVLLWSVSCIRLLFCIEFVLHQQCIILVLVLCSCCIRSFGLELFCVGIVFAV